MTEKEKVQEAKAELMQISKIDRLITRLTNTVATLRSSLTSGNYELKQDVVQTSGPKNPIETIIIKIVDLEDQINGQIDELITRKADAMKLIGAISDLDQRNILVARYVQGEKWENIADEVDHDIRWVFRVHGNALLSYVSVKDSMK